MVAREFRDGLGKYHAQLPRIDNGAHRRRISASSFVTTTSPTAGLITATSSMLLNDASTHAPPIDTTYRINEQYSIEMPTMHDLFTSHIAAATLLAIAAS